VTIGKGDGVTMNEAVNNAVLNCINNLLSFRKENQIDRIVRSLQSGHLWIEQLKENSLKGTKSFQNQNSSFSDVCLKFLWDHLEWFEFTSVRGGRGELGTVGLGTDGEFGLTNELATDRLFTDDKMNTNKLSIDKFTTDELSIKKLTTSVLKIAQLNTDKLTTDELTSDKLTTGELNTDKLTSELITDKLTAGELTTNKLATDELSIKLTTSELTINKLSIDELSTKKLTDDELRINTEIVRELEMANTNICYAVTKNRFVWFFIYNN
jgi:hypothetical protein